MRPSVIVLAALLAGCSSPPSTPPDLGRDLMLVFPEGCMNGSHDGNETDVDCGGDACKKCDAGQMCLHGSDCTSTICDNNVCAGPSCTDRLLNGSETDMDCGGTCPGCAVGRKCLRSGDCTSGNCVNNVCQPGACMNNVKDGMETDVDCGGPTCPACANGKACLMGSDCQVMRCINNVCQTPINCTPPMANCDGNQQSGCNINLNTDAKNCGKCGMVCPMNMPTCIDSRCSALDTSGNFTSYANEGRTVYFWKTSQCADLTKLTDFCTKRGLRWWRPRSQADAQKLFDFAYQIDMSTTWVQVFGLTTTLGTVGGYSVTVSKNNTCLEASNGGFAAIRWRDCSYCNPQSNAMLMTNNQSCCWDKQHPYDWLACEI